jgi:DNA polymerase-4
VLARQEQYAAFHRRIVEVVEQCLPVERVMSIDEMACLLSGSQRVPENAVGLAKQVKRAIHQSVGECLRCSIGLAPNLFLSKMASDMEKPDGLTVLRSGNAQPRLESLSLRDIYGIGPRMEFHLRQQGISSVRELYALTAKQMRAMWGSVVGERYWYWLRGYDFHDTLPQPQSVGHQHVLPPKLRTPEMARVVGRKLLCRAAARLRKMQMWARGISVYLSFAPGREKRIWESHTRIPESQDTFTLLEVLNRLWRDCPAGNPVFVGVALYDLVPDEQHTPSLLPEEKKFTKLADVMDSLQERFGPRSVYLASVDTVRDAAPARIAFSSIPEEKAFVENVATPKRTRRRG